MITTYRALSILFVFSVTFSLLAAVDNYTPYQYDVAVPYEGEDTPFPYAPSEEYYDEFTDKK